MVYVNAVKLVANCLEKKCCENRTVYSARKCEEYLLVSNLLTDELYLVSNEVLHVPVCFSFTCVEYEALYCVHDEFLIVSELSKLNFAKRLVMTCCHYRETSLIYFWKNIDRHSVDYIVRTTIDDDTFYVRESFKLLSCDVVWVNFAVNTQCTDCSCNHCVLMAAKV